jgi:PAS domain S-box-containing protein
MYDAPVGVVLLDPTRRPIEANVALQALPGYREEELKGMPFAQHVHPENLSHGREFFLQLAAGTIEASMIHKRLRHSGGHVIPTKMRVFLVRDRNGLPKHAISIVDHVPDSVAKILDSFGSADLPCSGTSGHSATCQ